jgi:hypothetical protein
MPKVTLSISVDLDDLEILSEIKGKYHLKNHSQAMHTLIKQWSMFIDERQKQQELLKENKKLPSLADKYKLKKPSNPLVDL